MLGATNFLTFTKPQRRHNKCHCKRGGEGGVLGCVSPASWLPLAMGQKITKPRAQPIFQLCYPVCKFC